MSMIALFISSAETIESISKRISPFFPCAGSIDAWAEKVGKRKIKLDWGSDCYCVNKQEIIDCITWRYRSDPLFNDPNKMFFWEGSPYLVNQLDELIQFCTGLSEEGSYAIVRSEL